MAELIKVNVVSGVLIEKEGKYLLVQEKKPTAYGLWNLPGGKVEERDSFEETAIRETKEEVGYDVRLKSKIGIFQNEPTKAVKHIFKAEIFSGELKFPTDEIIDAKWFTAEEIRALEAEGKLRDEHVLGAVNLQG